MKDTLHIKVTNIKDGEPEFIQMIDEKEQYLSQQIIINTQGNNFIACPDDSISLLGTFIVKVINFQDDTLYINLPQDKSHLLNFEIDTSQSNITDVIIFKNDFEKSLDFHFIQSPFNSGYIWSYIPNTELPGLATTIHIPSDKTLKEREYTDHNLKIFYDDKGSHFLIPNYRTFSVYLNK